ncbi:Cysteine dioxygenase type 1 [Thelohanellus kitauei]|uniref:Cysteine dioxygenase n=1 Tax=Thelohanellus kitauei TaxID=669202 RepID=A0A0C2N7P4_THEKT|nr:Cysteine dioxygenase type 1 [Thelohanellus kitauei]
MSDQKNTLSLTQLVQELEKLADAKKLTKELVHSLLEQYKSKEEEWTRYVKFSDQRYSRVLVHECPDKFNVMVLCWSENQFSTIHDHPQSDCHVKVLQGSIKETIYKKPPTSCCCSKTLNKKLEKKSELVHQTNSVTYIHGMFFDIKSIDRRDGTYGDTNDLISRMAEACGSGRVHLT